MTLRRPPLEAWFDEHETGVRFHLARTMIPCPLVLGLDAPFRTAYPSSRGERALRRNIATLEGVEPDEVLLVTGGTGGNAVALLAMATPDREVLIQAPAYYQLSGLAHRLAPGHVTFDPWTPGLPPADRPRTLMVTSPDNPTGRLLPETSWTGESDDCWIVDEVYRGMRTGDGHALAARREQVISVGAASKRFGIPGLRLGWVLARRSDWMGGLHSAQEHLAHSLPPGATDWALRHWEALLAWEHEARRLADGFLGILDSFSAAFEDRGFSLPRPDRGLSTLLRGPGLAEDETVARTLAGKGILVVPGSHVGHPGSLRVSLGLRSEEEVDKALQALLEAVG